MTSELEQSSDEDLAVLTSLRRAVKNALERKRRLGHYAVVWRDGKPALLDEDAEDREAFYEALKREPDYKQEPEDVRGPQTGVADDQGRIRSGSQ